MQYSSGSLVDCGIPLSTLTRLCSSTVLSEEGEHGRGVENTWLKLIGSTNLQ